MVRNQKRIQLFGSWIQTEGRIFSPVNASELVFWRSTKSIWDWLSFHTSAINFCPKYEENIDYAVIISSEIDQSLDYFERDFSVKTAR